MTEDKYRDMFIEALKEASMQRFSVSAHSRQDQNYIPDISFAGGGVDGWIEVKYCKKRPKTLNSIKHYTIGQEQFLIERGRAGAGRCYLLVGVESQGGSSTLIAWENLRDGRHQPFPYRPWAYRVGVGHMVWLARGLVSHIYGRPVSRT